jgi:membrane-bound metal-dependent hydrolase YbcI (DUF457 family)
MSEWLTHVFVAYSLLTLASWRLDWLDERWIAVGVVGSILPDFSRLDLLVDADTVTAVLGIPFEWGAIHTLAGVVLLAGIGAVLFDRRHEQVRAFGLLCAGGALHILVDVPQPYADGQTLTNRYLYPLPPWRLPIPGVYVSPDRWLAVVSLTVAVAVFLANRYVVPAEQSD